MGEHVNSHGFTSIRTWQWAMHSDSACPTNVRSGIPAAFPVRHLGMRGLIQSGGDAAIYVWAETWSRCIWPCCYVRIEVMFFRFARRLSLCYTQTFRKMAAIGEADREW